MARKGNQQRNGVNHNPSSHKKKVSDSGNARSNVKEKGKPSEAKVFPREQLGKSDSPFGAPVDDVSRAFHAGDQNKVEQDSRESEENEKQEIEELQDHEQFLSSGNNSGEGNSPRWETPIPRDENGSLSSSESDSRHTMIGFSPLLDGFSMKRMMESVEFSRNLTIGNLRALALHMMSKASEWLERKKPLFFEFITSICKARDYVKLKIEKSYPIVWRWVIHFANIFLLLSMVWLDCTLRGIDSFLRLGTTTFFVALWCSVFSIIAMAGISKFLIALAIAAFVGVFIGFTLGLLALAIFGTTFLWVYGSFWTTAFVITIGGLAFMSGHERVSLLISTIYSVYCAWMYVGWLGLLLAFNLSFISSDILVYFVKNNIIRQRRSSGTPEQFTETEGQPGVFNGESSETGPGLSQDRGPGIPSTSGIDTELTSEDEVIRLLNSADHYSALGLSRYENVDASLLKKEYRKKAMLVHPDKNMGNEKAAEAFKKLQNAYEVLLDSEKRKAYDDELRGEELLNYFRRFQSNSQKNGEDGFFSQANGEDPFIDARRIACKKCRNFHIWLQTNKPKSQARWCQDCEEFHPAKDGDGWVEQSSQPIFFGLLQKVDTPIAYVCADGKVYNATEWHICQGMRCPANTHKPSFHVNTSIISHKQNPKKGSSSGQRSGTMPNMEEMMTEEEFFEWLQNAGVFDNFSGNQSSESPQPPRGAKGSGGSNTSGGGGSSSSNRRKKKGKKQW